MVPKFKINRFIVLSTMFLFFLALPVSSQAATYYVDAYSGSDAWEGSAESPFQTIQYAIDKAEVVDNDIIIVNDGTYLENINVTKELTIRSEDLKSNGENDSAIVEAGETTDHVVEITADNVIIEGFTIYGASASDKAGIFLNNTTNCTVANNSSGESNYHGIWLYKAAGNNISNNTFSNNAQDGICLDQSTGNSCLYNTCNNNGSCGINIYQESGSNIVSGNTFDSNTANGIKIDIASQSNILTYNTSASNGTGIFLDGGDADNNRIFLNRFDGNTTNVDSAEGCINTWDSEKARTYYYNGKWRTSQLGNYYSDHTLTDSNGDGITDSAYPLPNDEPGDDYPLFATPDNYTYLENGLVAYYPFSGNANDASLLYSNDGTVNGGTSPTKDISGNPDSAYLFGGVNTDYINCGNDASLNISGAISIAAWVKSVSDTEGDGIVAKWQTTGEGYIFRIHYNEPSSYYGLEFILNFSLNTGTSFEKYNDRWTFVVATSDDTNTTIYINGNQVKSLPIAAPILVSRSNMNIGKHSTNYFNGTIDEVRLYNRALSQEEITKLYNDYRIKFNPGVLMMLLN